jgi:hypothetical protein
LQGNNWGGQIVKTLSSYDHQGFRTGPLRSEWITFGSAKFCCCFKLIRTQTLAGRGTRVPLSLCWRNIRELGGRVIQLDYLLYLLYLCILMSFRILTA